jgi:hypothetical protein
LVGSPREWYQGISEKIYHGIDILHGSIGPGLMLNGLGLMLNRPVLMLNTWPYVERTGPYVERNGLYVEATIVIYLCYIFWHCKLWPLWPKKIWVIELWTKIFFVGLGFSYPRYYYLSSTCYILWDICKMCF